MAKPTPWDRKLKRIRERSWATVRDSWLNFIPTNVKNLGSPHTQASSDIDLQSWLATVPPNESETFTTETFAAFRSASVFDCFFLLTKAIHVFEIVTEQVTHGRVTWALSNSYHASYFSLHSIMGLLGVFSLDIDRRKYFIVDIWTPGPKEVYRKLRGKAEKPLSAGTLVIPSSNPLHHNKWALFKRMLTISQIDSGAGYTQNRLAHLQGKDFPRQRNGLHYRTDYWPFDDLHCSLPEGSSQLHLELTDSDFGNVDSPLFSIILATSIIDMNLRLFNDLSTQARQMGPATQALESRFLAASESLNPALLEIVRPQAI